MKSLCILAAFVCSLQFALAADPTPASAPDAASDPNPGGFAGKVLETTNAAGYTYVHVDTGAKKIWAVTTKFSVNVGDGVMVGKGMSMGQYHSKALNRDFDNVFFADSITVNGDAGAAGATPTLPPGHPPIGGDSTPALPPGHPALTAPQEKPNLDLTGIKKADGGNTIREIYAGKDTLAGKRVVVRGKVVKYNAMILGKNWLHIQDGSGSADHGDNDLAVTTATPAALGATVLVTGTVSTNRDFGAGYKYGVIIENADVTAE